MMVAPRSILIIEPDESQRHGFAYAMESLFDCVETTACLSDAEKRLETARFDCILTETRFPMESGTDLLIRIAGKSPGTKIIVCSTGLNTETRNRLARHGITLFIDKPVPLQILSELLNQAGIQQTKGEET